MEVGNTAGTHVPHLAQSSSRSPGIDQPLILVRPKPRHALVAGCSYCLEAVAWRAQLDSSPSAASVLAA
jgi:hypothetical protein